jgi:AraC-like DNA-binding protein
MKKNNAKRPCLADKAASIASQGRSVMAHKLEYATETPTTIPANGRAQLLCPQDSLAIIETATSRFIVPLGYAAWISPGSEHEVSVAGGKRVITASIEPTSSLRVPDADCVIGLTPLMQALAGEIASQPRTGKLDRHDSLLMHLFIDELAAPSVQRFELLHPTDPRLSFVCKALLADPANADTAMVWAQRIGVTAKTLTRLFRRETGLTFVRWRQLARLFQAIACLGHGATVSAASQAAGYANPSNFAALFRRDFNIKPTEAVRLWLPDLRRAQRGALAMPPQSRRASLKSGS